MGPGQGEGIGGRRRHFRLGALSETVELLPGGRPRRGEPIPQACEWVPVLVRFAFRRRLVVPVLVRERVGEQADQAGLDQGRSLARADVVERFLKGAVGVLVVAAVALEDLQIREAPGERRDGAARGLVFHRHRDGVTVVLDEEQNRQSPERGAVQRLPELPLAGRAVAAAHQDDPVSVRRRRESRDSMPAQVSLRVRRADRVQKLCSHATRVDGQAERALREVRRHLPPAGGGIGRRAPGSRELFQRRQAQPGGEGAVPVVRVDPVGLGPEQGGGGGGNGLVARGADLEERLVLPLEGYLPQVHLPGGEHHPVGGFQLFRTKRRNVFGFALYDRIPPVSVRGFPGPLLDPFYGSRGCSGDAARVPAVGARNLIVGHQRDRNLADRQPTGVFMGT